MEVLINCCAQIAGAAPDTPFYFYDIPSLTGVNLPMPEFLVRAREAIPSLRGIKYTNPDMIALQECLRVAGGAFDILWGTDECLLSALALGVAGAVGSTYNVAAPVAHKIMSAFANHDLEAARKAQFRIVQLVRLLARYGYLGASKALMKMLGVDVGPTRLPLENPTHQQTGRMRKELEDLGYFDWIAQPQLQRMNPQ
jgi:N-acetylneuraminate lyase